MTITRVGTSKKYAQNWQQAFGGKRAKSASAEATKKQASKKKMSAKSTKSKAAAKK